MKQRWCAGAKTLVKALRQKKPSSAAAPSRGDAAAPTKGKPDKNKLSKESLMLHEAVMSARERTQRIEKRKLIKAESKSGLAPPVAPLQGLPRKKTATLVVALP
jgi:hypothetical protein